jgi:hypothetical protein
MSGILFVAIVVLLFIGIVVITNVKKKGREVERELYRLREE